MSVHWTSWAWKQDTGGILYKLVLVKLADNANDDGECFRNQKRLANECECTREAVCRAIRHLETLGLISSEPQRRNGKATINIYSLTPNNHPSPAQTNEGCDRGSQGGVIEDHRGCDRGSQQEPSIGTVTKEPSPCSPPQGDAGLFEGEGDPASSDTSSPPKRTKDGYPEAFEKFWQAYPRGEQGGPNRKVGKPKAYEKWRKAAQHVSTDDLVTAAERYAWVMKQSGKLQFVKMPTGWLNQGFYESFLGAEWEEQRKQLKPAKDDSWRYMV